MRRRNFAGDVGELAGGLEILQETCAGVQAT